MIDLSHPDPLAVLTPPAHASLAEAFLCIAHQHADRPAITWEGHTLSFRELEARAIAIACALQAMALPENSLVAICLERSPGLVASMLGVILAGHAYLPLDPAYPEERLRRTLADADADALLAGEDTCKALAGLSLHPVIVDRDGLRDGLRNTRPFPPYQPVAAADDDPLAYVIYTSGSTGAPKGVMVSQSNVLRLFQATEPWFHFTPDDVWTMFHSFSFDFSVWEMWGPLLTGGRLVIVPFAISRSPDEFRALLSDEGVTIVNQTPTAFRLLEEADRTASTPLALRFIIFGGEALVLRSLLPWIERHGDEHPQLINMYGITETTVHVTYRRILRTDAEQEIESPIGEPIPDLKVHLLDDHLQPVPDGTAGEIYVAGAGVAPGYLHEANLTAARFLEDPFATPASQRLYRSGDLARRRDDGELIYLGRADRQVKINGFRVELAEVEAALLRSPAISQLCVAALDGDTSGQRLVAFFIPHPGATAEDLSRLAAETLPAHMRPSLYQPVDRLPLTINGKLDLSALSMPVATPSSPVRPGATVEEIVREAWTQVLGRADVLPGENFFDAGGTSVQLIALRALLQTHLNRSLPITWFFQHSTLTSLTRKLQEADTPSVPVVVPQGSSAQHARAAWLAAQAKRKQAR